jgi:hypothetical protein
MFWLQAIYGSSNLLKYSYILAISPRTHYKIISFLKYKTIKKIKTIFVDVASFSYVCKMVEIHHQKNQLHH